MMNLSRLKILYVLFTLISSFPLFAQSVSNGIDENLVDVIDVYQFDLAGTWTVYTYDIVYDNTAQKAVTFKPSDTIESVVFNRLIGFPSRAYRLFSVEGQNIWKDAVFNLDSGETAYNVYWLGADDTEWVAKATTYGEMGVQFNIDIPDSREGFDENLFIELVRN